MVMGISPQPLSDKNITENGECKMNYIIFDEQMGLFRVNVCYGKEGIISEAQFLVECSQTDEEPYSKEIRTVENAIEFLEEYDYTIFSIDEKGVDIFENLACKAETNRLSMTLQDEFLSQAESYKCEKITEWRM